MAPELTPDDKQFVDLLYGALSSPKFEEMMRNAAEERPFEVAFAEWVEQGLWDKEEIESARALHEENQSGEDALQGQFVNAIRDLALTVAGTDSKRLGHIPLLLMPTGQLNARVFAAPSGLPVVVLNHGLIAQMGFVISAVLSFISWHDEDPFCKDLPQTDYGAAIVGLAASVATEDQRYLYPHRETLRFESLGDFNRDLDMWLQLTEAFIVLHEFGHVVRGHLEPEERRTPTEIPQAFEYSRTQLDEFEADAYAFERIRKSGEGRLRSTDVAFVAGLTLRFLALCERISGARSDTHPPAICRWERIKALAGLDEQPEALAHRLDGGFGLIETRLFESPDAG